MIEKHIWIPPNHKTWWRKHNPEYTNEEWYEAFNELVWYCISQGMKTWDYSTKNLLKEMTPYIENLRLTIQKP